MLQTRNPLPEARRAEIEKYVRSYTKDNYRMKPKRLADAVAALRGLPNRSACLDVSCGRGEMMREAALLGFSPVTGTEVVPNLIDGTSIVYAEAHALLFEDDSFDVVTLFDVIEHLLPGDDEAACREMARVARKHVVVSANNNESWSGEDCLHVNRRPYEEWDRLFRAWFPGKVTRLGAKEYVSELWRVDL